MSTSIFEQGCARREAQWRSEIENCGSGLEGRDIESLIKQKNAVLSELRTSTV